MQDFLSDKKLLQFMLIVLIGALCFSACRDMYYGTRPFDYPNSVWVCESPYIRVVIGSNKETNAYLGSEANEQEFQLLFGYGNDVDAIKQGTQLVSDETILFKGYCTFAEESFTINISSDNIWGGKYKILHFLRKE